MRYVRAVSATLLLDGRHGFMKRSKIKEEKSPDWQINNNTSSGRYKMGYSI
jgi:hypothetical protein